MKIKEKKNVAGVCCAVSSALRVTKIALAAVVSWISKSNF